MAPKGRGVVLIQREENDADIIASDFNSSACRERGREGMSSIDKAWNETLLIPQTCKNQNSAAASFWKKRVLEPPVPVVQVVQIPQVQVIDKIVVTPVVRTAQSTQTSESLGTAVRHVEFAETAEVMEFAPPLPTESAPPVCVTALVVDVPPMAVVDVQPAPVVAPLAVVTYAALGPVVEDIAPAPAVTYAEQLPVDEYLAHVVEYIAPAPAVIHAEQAPVDDYSAPAPAVTYAAPARAFEHVAPTQLVHDVARAPAESIDESSTPVCVGDTGFDALWGRHCEVIHIGDRNGEIRVLYADEDPDDWRSGTNIQSLLQAPWQARTSPALSASFYRERDKTLTTRDGSDSMLKTKQPMNYC